MGRTGIIWSVVYINAKCIYSPETHARAIIECAIVGNFCHVTSNFPLIYWWSGAANASRTPRTVRPYWNYLEVNCLPSSVLTISIFHHPNSSNFPNIYWICLVCLWIPQRWYFPYHKVLEPWNKHPQLRDN